MHGSVFSYPVLIKESHLDTFGHVNNATYLTLFEEARWDLITQNGYGLKTIRETQIGPTILEINLKFLKEIRLRDQITIESQMISYDNKIARMTQKMLRDGEVCCEAVFVIGLFDLNARKLILPTPEWLKAIGLA